MDSAGWHRRGYLPHFDGEHVYQFVTFRLADSLPQVKLRDLEAELATLPEERRDSERRRRVERWLDAGMGSCALGHPAVAQVVQEALFRFDGQRYHLLAWCIMPNHVHVLIETLVPLAKTVQSWKSFTGRWALQHADELGLDLPECRAGARRSQDRCSQGDRRSQQRRWFWMRDYWDRYIRDERHFVAVVDYIHCNPVKAGLCTKPDDWEWSGHRLMPGGAERKKEDAQL